MATDSESPSSLVLVAPMPRRPIALVARRQPAHQSRSRAARTTTQAGTMQQSAPVSSTTQPAETTRSHPYSRAKTPVSGGFGAMSPTMLPLVGDIAAPMGHARRRSSARNTDALDSTALLPAAITALSMSASSKDEPMVIAAPTEEQPVSSEQPAASDPPIVTSPVQRPAGSLAAMGRTLSDVDRTPTKKALRQMATQLSPDDREDTPSLHPASNLDGVPEELLALSPTLPATQRLGPAFSSPRSPINATLSGPNAVSATPSPSLSESQSRSPSSSPSPCPSPSFADDMRSHSPRLASDWPHAGDNESSNAYSSVKDMIPLLLSQRRKLGLPLPVPTSPIPRKMTRNPFERSLNLHHQLVQWSADAESVGDHVMVDGAVEQSADMQEE